MAELSNAQEQSLCDMYRGGASFRTLELAFGASTDEIIQILQRNGVVQPNPGESTEAFMERIRQDVAHESAA
jgi:hypothetical protein